MARVLVRGTSDRGAVVTTATATRISFELEHGGACAELGGPLLEQLRHGYERCSVMEIPNDLDEWRYEHRTARKRAARAHARGYYFHALERERHGEELHAINTSAAYRQGRPMSSGYLAPQTYAPLPNFVCDRHAIRATGVWTSRSELVGYLVVYRCGELALVSQILGHAEHLAAEIMYLLFVGALAREIDAGEGYVVYNRHDSGTDGLRFFKERLGFREEVVAWAP